MVKPSDLIKEDLIEGKQQGYDYTGFSENIERYAKNLCGRIDTHLPTEKGHLLLNKPAVPNKHSIVKSVDVSLKESVMLQITHDNKLKVKLYFVSKETYRAATCVRSAAHIPY